ncbi:MAG: putative radical SAM domain-containing protein [Nitrospirae bacterium]|nr:MAG: putative radical SAM domain-containing protein [Nitrospirota bacterium]
MNDKNNHEKTFKEVAGEHPDFPGIIMRKIDTALRGVTLTERALERAKEEGALYDVSADLGLKTPRLVLGGALFRDGTVVLGLEDMYLQFPEKFIRRGSSYTLDAVDGRLWLLDGKERVEEVFFVPVPDYFGKKTSRGTPMLKVATPRFPCCLFVRLYNYCHFWEEKTPCRYCSFVKAEEGPAFTQESLEDLRETIEEALKEQGRWMTLFLSGGSDPRGNSPYGNTADEYVKALRTLQSTFGTEKVYARVVANAFPREELLRLKEAGAVTYEPHIEVWDEKLFEWICPGKAKYYGRQYWIDSALSAVEIFGRGNVCTQFVGGVELTQPNGFKTIDEGLKSTLEGVEFFARHGVASSFFILWVVGGSIFYAQKQKPAPLEYHVRLAKGVRDIQKRYELSMDFNNYRCSSGRPDVDLARLDYNLK